MSDVSRARRPSLGCRSSVKKKDGAYVVSSRLPMYQSRKSVLPFQVENSILFQFKDQFAALSENICSFAIHNGSAFTNHSELTARMKELDELFNMFYQSLTRNNYQVNSIFKTKKFSQGSENKVIKRFISLWDAIMKEIDQMKREGVDTIHRSIDIHMQTITKSLSAIQNVPTNKQFVKSAALRLYRSLMFRFGAIMKSVKSTLRENNDLEKTQSLCEDIRSFSRQLNDAYIHEFSDLGFPQSEIARIRASTYTTCSEIVRQIKLCCTYGNDIQDLNRKAAEFNGVLHSVLLQFNIQPDDVSECANYLTTKSIKIPERISIELNENDTVTMMIDFGIANISSLLSSPDVLRSYFTQLRKRAVMEEKERTTLENKLHAIKIGENCNCHDPPLINGQQSNDKPKDDSFQILQEGYDALKSAVIDLINIRIPEDNNACKSQEKLINDMKYVIADLNDNRATRGIMCSILNESENADISNTNLAGKLKEIHISTVKELRDFKATVDNWSRRLLNYLAASPMSDELLEEVYQAVKRIIETYEAQLDEIRKTKTAASDEFVITLLNILTDENITENREQYVVDNVRGLKSENNKLQMNAEKMQMSVKLTNAELDKLNTIVSKFVSMLTNKMSLQITGMTLLDQFIELAEKFENYNMSSNDESDKRILLLLESKIVPNASDDKSRPSTVVYNNIIESVLQMQVDSKNVSHELWQIRELIMSKLPRQTTTINYQATPAITLLETLTSEIYTSSQLSSYLKPMIDSGNVSSTSDPKVYLPELSAQFVNFIKTTEDIKPYATILSAIYCAFSDNESFSFQSRAFAKLESSVNDFRQAVLKTKDNNSIFILVANRLIQAYTCLVTLLKSLELANTAENIQSFALFKKGMQVL